MSQPLTQDDIAAGLRQLGLSSGDCVILHSSLSSLGEVVGGADTVVDAFLEVLGSNGTLVVPTFDDFGAIPESVRNRPDACHSIHPKASVAAVGAKAEGICRDHWKAQTAHGEGTPYLRMAELGGYVCLLGVDQDRNTSLHTVEALLKLPYLNQTDEFTFDTPEGEVTKSWSCSPGPHRDFIRLDVFLRRRIVKQTRIGTSVVRLMNSRDMIDSLVDLGRADPAFALCLNFNCADCVMQRAAIRHQRLAREDFTVAAAATLAGPDVVSIVANCRAAGIEQLELDGIDGRSLQSMPPLEVVRCVDELRDAGLSVISLRATALAENPQILLDMAVDCEVERVVLPLNPLASRLVPPALERGLSVAFFNADLGGEQVFEIMHSMSSETGAESLVFSAANFARMGEKPFSTSFNNKLKRFTTQLDVEDCTLDGIPARLAGGNAEIKELISILRCSTFSGYMVLGRGNGDAGLLETADRFVHLLDTM